MNIADDLGSNDSHQNQIQTGIKSTLVTQDKENILTEDDDNKKDAKKFGSP